MRKKSLFAMLGVAAVAATLSACSGSSEPDDAGSTSADGTASCETASLAGLDDDSHRVAFYALENGLVESDLIPGVDVSYLQIPALIQATSSGQFDYTMTSLNGVVNAREAGGLDLRVVAYSLAHSGAGIALYTRADSGIASAEDLKGKRIATPSFGSTATQEAQIVLEEKYGLNADIEGGDLTWVELDPPTQLNALKQGDIDVALMWHLGGWTASNDPELEKLTALDTDYKEIANGAWPIGAAFVADGEFVDANPECVAEFQRMLAESVAYAEENYTEIGAEVSATSGVPAEFIDFWWQPEHYEFGGVVDDRWLGYVDEFYALAYEHGFIPVDADPRDFTVIPTS